MHEHDLAPPGGILITDRWRRLDSAAMRPYGKAGLPPEICFSRIPHLASLLASQLFSTLTTLVMVHMNPSSTGRTGPLPFLVIEIALYPKL